MPANYYKYY